MEELLIAIFQFFFEVVLQTLMELPWDICVSSRESRRNQSPNKFQWLFLSLLMGGAVGSISLWIWPNTAMRSSGLRLAYLLLAPPCSAWISFLVARCLAHRSRPWIQPGLHAQCAFCFTLVLTVVRFTYAHRPP